MNRLITTLYFIRIIGLPKLFFIGVLLIIFSACSNKRKAQMGKQGIDSDVVSSVSNTLTSQEKQGGWKLLFDGQSVDKWRKVYGKKFPKQGWKVHDGVLTVLSSNGRQGGDGGSIVTKEEYANFELQLDYKLTKGANSGIKYFVVENPDFFKDPSSGSAIGLEYQVIDGKNWPDKLNDNQLVGALYDMIPAANHKKINPIGQWNHARIVSKEKHVEHWLNGQKVVEYERGSDAFRALYERSKFTKYPNFGLASKGHIALQDHGTRVSFRNIKIRELN